MTEIVVVGGGIAGLTAAALLGKSGRSVTVIEQAERFGGRAGTQTTADGFHFNMGPHALYRGGHATRVLRELGITINESRVGASGSNAVKNRRVQPLPVGAISLFTTTLFSLSGKLELARLLAELPRMDLRSLAGVSLRQWLATEIQNVSVREMFEALIRVSTYSNAPEEASAGAALEQLQIAVRGGVSYLNGGWQTLVDRVRQTAEAAGVNLRSNASAGSVEYESGEVRGIRLSNGTLIKANTVILAVSPKTALTLLGDASGLQLRHWIESALPVRAACLDLGLRRISKPERSFALGFDLPMYLSIHSRWAELGPKGAALVHVAKYLAPNKESDPSDDRRELEAFIDLVQPGWRQEIAHVRFLPKLTVTPALVRARDGGLAGRPAVDALELRNAYLAGDWVGTEGMLADASFASAHRAARLIIGKRQLVLHAQAV